MSTGCPLCTPSAWTRVNMRAASLAHLHPSAPPQQMVCLLTTTRPSGGGLFHAAPNSQTQHGITLCSSHERDSTPSWSIHSSSCSWLHTPSTTPPLFVVHPFVTLMATQRTHATWACSHANAHGRTAPPHAFPHMTHDFLSLQAFSCPIMAPAMSEIASLLSMYECGHARNRFLIMLGSPSSGSSMPHPPPASSLSSEVCVSASACTSGPSVALVASCRSKGSDQGRGGRTQHEVTLSLCHDQSMEGTFTAAVHYVVGRNLVHQLR